METKIITGDCIRVMRAMTPDSFDVAVTSPPYNIGIDYRKHNDKMQTAGYLAWCYQWASEVRRLLREDGSFFLNIAAPPSAPTLPFQVAECLQRLFVLQNTFHWIKAISIGDKSVGHFKPINSPRYVTNLHEYIFHFSFHGDAKLKRLAVGVPYADKSNIKRWGHTGGRDLRCKGNVWFIPYDTIVCQGRQALRIAVLRRDRH
jgi:site-specific DNA-methyltransferase (adenine-specific)